MTKSNYYYIVEIKCKEVKAFDGSVLTPEDQTAYLSHTDEGGGWPTVSRNKASAQRFDKFPSKKDIASWDGMPWYYRIKSANVIPVEETLIHTIKEGTPIEI